MKRPKKSRKLSRRQFVKEGIGYGVAAATMGSVGCTSLGRGRVPASNSDDGFDYIVVGSGAGGGPVACNLAKAGYRVLLLEAGSNTKPAVNAAPTTASTDYDVPALHPFASQNKELSWDFYYLTWAILKGHTQNKSGTVTLRSADPFDTPIINFNYFKDDPEDGDLKAILKGIEYAREINKNPLLNNLIEAEDQPKLEGKALEEWVKSQTWGHHASCTNKIGGDDDPNAVLDSKFRVRGVQNLRVVDASVFPNVPGLFIVVPIYMIAEKASDDIISAAKAFPI